MDLTNYRRKRVKKKLQRSVLPIIFFFIVILGSLAYLLWGPTFLVKSSDLILPSDESFQVAFLKWFNDREAGWLPINNYFLLREREVLTFVASYGKIGFEVRKHFPGKLEVIFSEFEPFAIYCEAINGCYFVEQLGLLYEYAPKIEGGPLVILRSRTPVSLGVGDTLFRAETMGFISNFLSEAQKANIDVLEIEVAEEDREIKVLVQAGWYLYLSSISEPKKTLDDLNLLVEQKIGIENLANLSYIDMRFENKAFYKLK